jgi:hypothetical protein
MEPEGSSPHTQAPATCPYPEPAQSNHTLILPPEGIQAPNIPRPYKRVPFPFPVA